MSFDALETEAANAKFLIELRACDNDPVPPLKVKSEQELASRIADLRAELADYAAAVYPRGAAGGKRRSRTSHVPPAGNHKEAHFVSACPPNADVLLWRVFESFLARQDGADRFVPLLRRLNKFEADWAAGCPASVLDKPGRQLIDDLDAGGAAAGATGDEAGDAAGGAAGDDGRVCDAEAVDEARQRFALGLQTRKATAKSAAKAGKATKAAAKAAAEASTEPLIGADAVHVTVDDEAAAGSQSDADDGGASDSGGASDKGKAPVSASSSDAAASDGEGDALEADEPGIFSDCVANVHERLSKRFWAPFLASANFVYFVQLDDYATSTTVDLNSFKIYRVLGTGAFGSVSAVQKKDTMTLYAVKEMNKKVMKLKSSTDVALTERNILRRLNNPFVLNLKYAFQDTKAVYMIMPCCRGGDLHYHLSRAPNKRFGEKQALFYAAEILIGLEHLHSQGVVYRDLKPNNILLDHRGHAVISDLGLARELPKDRALTQHSGTGGYMAPEVVARQPQDVTIDYWSLAVMLYEMLNGARPRNRAPTEDTYDPFRLAETEEAKAKSGVPAEVNITYPKDLMSAEVSDFISRVLVADPAARLGAGGRIQELMDHAAFADINFTLLRQKRIDPPFVPDEDVNTVSLYEAQGISTREARKQTLVDTDQKEYDGFEFASSQAWRDELVSMIDRNEAADALRGPGGGSGKKSQGCCCATM